MINKPTNKKNPLISILVCNYNYEKYIEESLNSIINQDYDNIEIIVIDDGSKDDSVNIIESYINKNSKYKIYLHAEKKNKGICHGRNKAISTAKGEYFLFIDSDDTIPTNYVTKLYETSIIEKADVVYCDMKSFGYSKSMTNFPEYDAEELLLHNYLSISSLVKKKSIKDHEFDVELNRKTLEDYDFWVGLSLMGLKFVKAKNIFLNYRIQKKSRNDNTSDQVTRISNYIEVWKYIINKYKKIYPDKIDDDIVFKELLFQVNDINNELYELNKEVQNQLIPELENRKKHIEYQENIIKELKIDNDNLKKDLESVEYKVGVKIMKPIRFVKKSLRKNGK